MKITDKIINQWKKHHFNPDCLFSYENKPQLKIRSVLKNGRIIEMIFDISPKDNCFRYYTSENQFIQLLIIDEDIIRNQCGMIFYEFPNKKGSFTTSLLKEEFIVDMEKPSIDIEYETLKTNKSSTSVYDCINKMLETKQDSSDETLKESYYIEDREIIPVYTKSISRRGEQVPSLDWRDVETGYLFSIGHSGIGLNCDGSLGGLYFHNFYYDTENKNKERSDYNNNNRLSLYYRKDKIPHYHGNNYYDLLSLISDVKKAEAEEKRLKDEKNNSIKKASSIFKEIKKIPGE